MGPKSRGTLVIIGGAEDKEGDCEILKKVVSLVEDRTLVILTTATARPQEVGGEYREIFGRLGVEGIRLLHVNSRPQAQRKEAAEALIDAGGIFFTGGDQLRITSLLGGTALAGSLHHAYREGSVVIGTSAGAAAMSDIMLVEGDSEEPPKKCTQKLAPGLGLLEEVVIDQHFAQRGRLGRLLGAIAQNPYILGIGIDEDTAVVVDNRAVLKVIGSQTVTIVDGRSMIYTNVSEQAPQKPLALFQVQLHILPRGFSYDLQQKEASPYQP